MSLEVSLEVEDGGSPSSLFDFAEAAGGRRFDDYVWFESSGLNVFIKGPGGDALIERMINLMTSAGNGA